MRHSKASRLIRSWLLPVVHPIRMNIMERLKKLAAGDKRIIFTGFVQGRILEELYSNSLMVYVLPSDLEGMLLSLLEAMSYGNCCLVSDIAECTEVVEDKAVVFKKSNVADLKEKLTCIFHDEKLVRKYKSEAEDLFLENIIGTMRGELWNCIKGK